LHLLSYGKDDKDEKVGGSMSNQTVTRADIADALHQEVGLSHNECSKLLDDVLKEITCALVEEEGVKLSSFGSFTIRHKDERMGRNPKTGEEAVVSARRAVVFKPSHKLKRQVDEREK